MFTHFGPEPLDELLSRSDVSDHRSLFCAEYEHCLDAALESGWVSWTCARCARFRALRLHDVAPPHALAARSAWAAH
jgi:hypothetical protein